MTETPNLPAVVPTPALDWRSMDTAPKDKPVILFCPWVNTPDGKGSHPDAKMAHGRIVGWWSDKLNGWASGLPGTAEVAVYPSRWTDLLEEPV